MRKVLASAAAAVLLLAAGGAAALDAEAAGRLVAERFEVEVLRVAPGMVGERAAWLVTVMRPGGDRNDAFQVSTLAVDRDSGDLIPSFRHGTSGYEVPPPAPGTGASEPGQVRPPGRTGLR